MAKRTGGTLKGGRHGNAAQPPDAGDLIWISFSPQAGREQAGRRPVIVLTPFAYNEKVGLCLACPITNQAKGYPFEVPLPTGLHVAGVILADHVKSLDWKVRGCEVVAHLPSEILDEVHIRLKALLKF